MARSRKKCRDVNSEQARCHHTLSTLSLSVVYDRELEAKQGLHIIPYQNEGKEERKKCKGEGVFTFTRPGSNIMCLRDKCYWSCDIIKQTIII